jgi:hypothetical protein
LRKIFSSLTDVDEIELDGRREEVFLRTVTGGEL